MPDTSDEMRPYGTAHPNFGPGFAISSDAMGTQKGQFDELLSSYDYLIDETQKTLNILEHRIERVVGVFPKDSGDASVKPPLPTVQGAGLIAAMKNRYFELERQLNMLRGLTDSLADL